MDAADVRAGLTQILRGSRSAASLESQTLDFKADKPTERESYQDLAEAAVCFANSTGGLIVVGVADSPVGPEAFLGTRLRIDALRSRIHALTEPPIVVTIEEIEYTADSTSRSI
jgi:ATP-dependent DNA helicase RecG